MLQINERPNITEVINTEEGYRTRTLCQVDGFPAEINIEVNHDNRQRYSSFDLSYYDYVDGRWRSLYSLNPREVGRMPMIGDDPETLVRLNEVASTLWQVATTILRTARERAEELETTDYVRNRRALDAERTIMTRLPELDAFSPGAQEFVDSFTPSAADEYDASEFTPDASDEERQG